MKCTTTIFIRHLIGHLSLHDIYITNSWFLTLHSCENPCFHASVKTYEVYLTLVEISYIQWANLMTLLFKIVAATILNFVFNMVAKLHGFFFYLYLHNFVLIKIWQQFKNAQTIFLYTFLSLLNLMVTILINFQTFLARGVLTSNYRITVEFLIAC